MLSSKDYYFEHTFFELSHRCPLSLILILDVGPFEFWKIN